MLSGIHNHCIVLATDFLLIWREGRYSDVICHITTAATMLKIAMPTAVDKVVMRYVVHEHIQTKEPNKIKRGSLLHQMVEVSAPHSHVRIPSRSSSPANQVQMSLSREPKWQVHDIYLILVSRAGIHYQCHSNFVMNLDWSLWSPSGENWHHYSHQGEKMYTVIQEKHE